MLEVICLKSSYIISIDVQKMLKLVGGMEPTDFAV